MRDNSKLVHSFLLETTDREDTPPLLFLNRPPPPKKPKKKQGLLGDSPQDGIHLNPAFFDRQPLPLNDRPAPEYTSNINDTFHR